MHYLSYSKKIICLLPLVLLAYCNIATSSEEKSPILEKSGSSFMRKNLKSSTLTSIGFFGFVKHARPTPQTHEGNMDYMSIGRTNHYKNFDFENGIGTYMDSYNKHSYVLFSNVSNNKIRSKYINLAIGLHCSFKGVDYGSDKRKWVCSPPLKVRVGSKKGLFAYITPIPKIGSLTNGLLAIESGLRF